MRAKSMSFVLPLKNSGKFFLAEKRKKKKRDVKMCSLSSSIYTLNRHKSIICFDFLLRLQSSSTV